MKIKEAVRRIEANEYGNDLASITELLEAVRMEGECREMMAKQSGGVTWTFLPKEHSATPIVIVIDEVVPFLVHSTRFEDDVDGLNIEESDVQRGLRVRARHVLGLLTYKYRNYDITLKPAVNEFQLLRLVERASYQAREDRLREFENYYDAVWEDS